MAKTTELTIPEAFQIGEVAVNKEVLLQRVEEACKATITGINDTVGYKAAIAHRASFRTVRTTLEKVRKEMSAPHQAFVKQLKERTDELGAIASKGEIYFDDLITAIDNEKERLRKEKEAQEQAKINGRIHQLFELGAKFDGEKYTFGYDESLFITPLQLKQEGDGAFADFVGDVNDAYNREQERIAAELLIQQEKETAERLQCEQDENDRLEREAELARQTDDLAIKAIVLREKELKLQGYTKFDGGWHDKNNSYKPIITEGDIIDMSDFVWDVEMETISNWIEPIIDPQPNTEAENLSMDDLEKMWPEESAVASGNPVQDSEQGYVTNEMQEAYVPYHSLIEFEIMVKSKSFTGTKKERSIILKAIEAFIEDYKNR